MTAIRLWKRLLILVLCLGLLWPALENDTEARRQRRKSSKVQKGRSKRGSKVSRSRGRGRGRVRRSRSRRRGSSGGSTVRRKGFDEMMNAKNAPEGTDEEMAGAQIEEFKLRAWIKYLSDDLLEGRGTGARGGFLAAKFIASEFEEMGLEPAGPQRSYFQLVPMFSVKTDPETKLVVKAADDKKEEFKFAEEFVASTDLEQPEIAINNDIVFVGHGINAPELNWNDYAGLDVKGKIVMMMVNDPPATAAEPNLFGGKALTYYGRWTYKFEEAARQGAAGVLLIHTTESAAYGWQVVRTGWDGEKFSLLPDDKTPTLKFKGWVTEDTARKIAQLGGQNLDALRTAARVRGFKAVPLTAKVETTLKTKSQRVTAPNVVAIFRGADQTLKDEYVIYSGHWDHLGIRPDQAGDNIYNGAVDNATGIAGMLAIARAFTNLEVKPKRSVLFIATTAEEQGLLGAEYYARNPLVPLAKSIANLNLDSMNVLGMTTDIAPLGAERSTLGKFIEEVCKENQITVVGDTHPEQGSFYRSDHFPFAKAGVPAVSFEPGAKFVGHPDDWGKEQFADYNKNRYHQPSDEYSATWDFSGMVQQARLAFWIGLRVCDAAETPQWNPGDEFERARLKSLGKL